MREQEEDAVVDRRGDDGNQAEAQQREVDLQRVGERVEMRRAVPGDVDGLDRLLDDANLAMLADQQHIEFEIVAVGDNPQHVRQQDAGHAAQPRLRVVQVLAGDNPHHAAREAITQLAAQRHVAGELPGSQNQHVALLLEPPRDGQDVLAQVLPVGVRGHHAGRVGPRAESMVECRLQRGALAQIDGMAQHRQVLHPRRLLEDLPALLAAAVIDHDDR